LTLDGVTENCADSEVRVPTRTWYPVPLLVSTNMVSPSAAGAGNATCGTLAKPATGCAAPNAAVRELRVAV
jgi:hypothetical protein